MSANVTSSLPPLTTAPPRLKTQLMTCVVADGVSTEFRDDWTAAASEGGTLVRIVIDCCPVAPMGATSTTTAASASDSVSKAPSWTSRCATLVRIVWMS